MNDETEIASLRVRVAELEDRLQYLYMHLGVPYLPEPRASEYDSTVAEYLKKGDTIRAIQAYRHRYRCGLPEANAAVDAMKAKLRY